MQCNLDAKGKAMRLQGGIVLSTIALAALLLGVFRLVDGSWLWYAGFALLAGGAFMIFEGVAGWCALRAMGIRMRD